MKRKPCDRNPSDCAHAEYKAAQSRRAVALYLMVMVISALFLIVISYLSHNRAGPQTLSNTPYSESSDYGARLDLSGNEDYIGGTSL